MRISVRMCYREKTVACWRGALSSDRQVLFKTPISGAQIRAARALLKWSVRELLLAAAFHTRRFRDARKLMIDLRCKSEISMRLS